MTEPTKPTVTTAKATEAAAKKAPAKKAAPAKGPVPSENTGRLDHSNCTHPRTPKGRAACRAERKKAAEAATTK
ncbi:hypothetical protein [Micromonospora sp. CA-246542]|uniref:hypothetical protein n=1 Tax=Micromonospora sp. CA-246542 TaxID=3239959 RepID=UPI003D8D9503